MKDMTTITVHKATLNDVEILVNNRILFATELGGERPKELIRANREQLERYFNKAIQDDSCISYIARCEGVVAGIGSVHMREMPGNFKNPSGKWGYIMNMYTVPAYRRRGVCSRILHALVDDATQHGITAFELHATEAGEQVYKQEGFSRHNEPIYRRFIQL